MTRPPVGGAGKTDGMARHTTIEDLHWWVDLAARLAWTFAKTYAESAPHSYVVHPRTEGLAPEDYVRAAHVIHTFGEPAKFYAMTSIYLTSPDGRLKWWTMDDDLNATGLINQATTDRLYGVQNAPSTRSGIATAYDAVATGYGNVHPVTVEERRHWEELVAPLRCRYAPSVLDVGCGTGRVLDLELTTPDRYAGVDPSQPMLNMLVRKYPGVGAVYPMTIEQVLEERTFTPGQFEFVTVCNRGPSITDETLAALERVASRALVLSDAAGLQTLISKSAPRAASVGARE